MATVVVGDLPGPLDREPSADASVLPRAILDHDPLDFLQEAGPGR